MKKINKPVISKICVLLGAALLFVGILVLVCWQWNINSSIQKSKTYVEALNNLIPEPQGAIPEERRDNSMPVISIDGADFIGIIEIPKYKSELPVGANWGHITNYPCKFSGSVYDGTIQIGATSQKGQYDFYREISVADTVIFTDVEGNRYTYEITNLRYEKHAEQTVLNQEEAALTLFIKNVYDIEYLIVSCNILNYTATA